MPQYKTIEDYFYKNDIRAMHKEIFILFCFHRYRIDISIKCIDAFMETLYLLLEREGISFVRETKYFDYTDEEGNARRKYLYEYSYATSSPDDWIPDIYYSFVD